MFLVGFRCVYFPMRVDMSKFHLRIQWQIQKIHLEVGGGGGFNDMFSFQPVLHDSCNKGRGMCYPVYKMVRIKEPLLLIGKSSQYGGNGFPLSLSEWSLTICVTPYNCKLLLFNRLLVYMIKFTVVYILCQYTRWSYSSC